MNKLFTTWAPGLVLMLAATSVKAQTITDFTVRESEQESETIELVALDASGNRQEDLDGAFPFSVNGFETELKFRDGGAFFPREVASSTFLYLKHNEGGHSAARLFYVYRGLAGSFTVFHIPLALLVIIPVALILLGMFFRRLIILMLLLLAAFFYFNSSKGLSPGSFFDAAKEWINGLL